MEQHDTQFIGSRHKTLKHSNQTCRMREREREYKSDNGFVVNHGNWLAAEYDEICTFQQFFLSVSPSLSLGEEAKINRCENHNPFIRVISIFCYHQHIDDNNDKNIRSNNYICLLCLTMFAWSKYTFVCSYTHTHSHTHLRSQINCLANVPGGIFHIGTAKTLSE